ncbi:MAG: conserved hypothetical protein [Marine Group I thaumarchaeote]|nr:MAG: conserved hypothetical protein [Marine Group I thaumarchaeote]
MIYLAVKTRLGLTKKKQILVIGNNEDSSTPELEKIAYETGAEIAKSSCVLITGGLGGVMEAASHGARDNGGIVVGIIPQNDPAYANEYCDIVIPSGLGLTRDFLTALSGDGVIVIGGGSGTLSEVCAAYMYNKPIAAIRGTGGTAEKYLDQYLDSRKKIKVIGVDSPKDAVKYILEQITS